MDTVLDWTNQTGGLHFKMSSTEEGRAQFYVNSKTAPTGSTPLVKVDFSKLPQSGMDKVRGVNPIFVKKTKKAFKKLKICVEGEEGHDVRKMCESVLKEWAKEYNPTTRSLWYQKMFDLKDGTEVYQATTAIQTMNTDAWKEVDILEDQFNCPSRTFGSFLFSDNPDAKWYIDATVPEPYDNDKQQSDPMLYLYDENGKKIKTRTCEGKVVYPTGGIELRDNVKLKELARSEFYMGMTFRARCCLGLSSLEWKCGTDTATSRKVIYPIFHFKTYGSIVLKSFPYTAPEGQIPVEKRMNITDAVLLEGLEPPSKRRKKTITGFKKGQERIEFDTDILSDDEIKGDSTQPLEDIEE